MGQVMREDAALFGTVPLASNEGRQCQVSIINCAQGTASDYTRRSIDYSVCYAVWICTRQRGGGGRIPANVTMHCVHDMFPYLGLL